ncbi:hypothetical protein IIA15_01510 [candidate division TA06 bacterium]|nr:hypothetical protein [candidate division TA06 bacterium]
MEVDVIRVSRFTAFWLFTFCFLLLASCGKKHGDPVGPYPTVPRLLADGWAAYVAGDYDLAIAKFDSFTVIKADEPDAYLGLGWSQSQIGQFTEALSNFSLAISLEGIRPVVEVFDEDSEVVPGTTWVIRPLSDTLNNPLLGLPDLTIKSIPADTLLDEAFYDVVSFTDSTITLAWSDENADTIPVPPVSADTLIVNYSYSDTTIVETERQVDAFAGMATLFSANNQDLMAILNGNGVLELDNNYFFSHDSTGANASRVHLLLAQSYYNLKLFENALREVLILEPTWIYDKTSAIYLFNLQRKIESLRGC